MPVDNRPRADRLALGLTTLRVDGYRAALQDHLAQAVPILLLSLLVAGLVYLWSSRQASVYQAVSQVNVDPAAEGPNPEQSALLAARTYAQLATSTPVLQDAILADPAR